MSKAAPSKIASVTAKQFVIDNDTSFDVKRLQLELAENAKALASNPSRPDAAQLNARQASIKAAIAAHD